MSLVVATYYSHPAERESTLITQIEIDGFKTFKDFKVELAPFQVIVGPNGSGKSNLFDALQLLSHLNAYGASGHTKNAVLSSGRN